MRAAATESRLRRRLQCKQHRCGGRGDVEHKEIGRGRGSIAGVREIAGSAKGYMRRRAWRSLPPSARAPGRRWQRCSCRRDHKRTTYMAGGAKWSTIGVWAAAGEVKRSGSADRRRKDVQGQSWDAAGLAVAPTRNRQRGDACKADLASRGWHWQGDESGMSKRRDDHWREGESVGLGGALVLLSREARNSKESIEYDHQLMSSCLPLVRAQRTRTRAQIKEKTRCICGPRDKWTVPRQQPLAAPSSP